MIFVSCTSIIGRRINGGTDAAPKRALTAAKEFMNGKYIDYSKMTAMYKQVYNSVVNASHVLDEPLSNAYWEYVGAVAKIGIKKPIATWK